MFDLVKKLHNGMRFVWWWWAGALYEFFHLPLQRLKSILFRDPMRQTRLWLALSSLTWAFLLSGRDVVFSDKRTTYHVMRELMSEDMWALVFLVHGVLAIWTLLWGCKKPAVLTTEAIVGCLVWTSSTVACFAAHWPTGPEFPTWVDQFHKFAAPAAMSGEFWLSVAAWLRLVLYWADTNLSHEEQKK